MLVRAESRLHLSKGDLRRGSFWLVARGDSVIDKAFLRISLWHHKSFMKENSFHTNQKLTKWHLWLIHLHSPYPLGVAAHVFRATLAWSWGQELHRQALISKRWPRPLGRKAPPSCKAAGRGPLIAASVDALQRVPCKRGGEDGKGGSGVRGGDGHCAPQISRWTWEWIAVMFPG